MDIDNIFDPNKIYKQTRTRVPISQVLPFLIFHFTDKITQAISSLPSFHIDTVSQTSCHMDTVSRISFHMDTLSWRATGSAHLHNNSANHTLLETK